MSDFGDTWRCDICGEMRPDALISVYKVDIGPKNLPAGTMIRNVKFCNDDPACAQAAENWDEEKFRAAGRRH